MPYGKRHDVAHVTRVPIKRLDSTGEISSESPNMIEVGSNFNSDSRFSLQGMKNMLEKKCFSNSFQNNLTAQDSNCAYNRIKDLLNIQSYETSRSVVDQKDSNKSSVRFTSAPVSWNQTMPAFHPAVIATSFVSSGVSSAHTSSDTMSHSYIPKMTYCNLNRCYQNKFKQKFLKGVTCNSQGGANKKVVHHHQPSQRKQCDKATKMNTSTQDSCSSSHNDTMVQTLLPEKCVQNERKSSIEASEENEDSQDIIPPLNHWTGLCSEDEDINLVQQVVPDCWDEEEEKELENNFTKHIISESSFPSQNDEHGENDSMCIYAQVTDNNSVEKTTESNDTHCDSLVAQMQVQKVDDCSAGSNCINDVDCDRNKAADIDTVENKSTCTDSTDSAQFQVKINSYQPPGQNGSIDNHDKEKNDNSFILFLRKDNKKKSKRRRRSKAKKSEENSDSEEQQSTSPPKCQNAAIAFMLGFSPDNKSQSTKPFYISFDDSDSAEFSDFSDTDDPYDEDKYSDIADQFDMPLNLSVICPIKPQQAEECSDELKEVNLRWRIQISRKPSSCSLDDNKSRHVGKKVHFADESDLTEVFPETQWAEEYQEARKGQWYQYGLDRERFQKRIAEVGEVLNRVLSEEHRQKVHDRLTEA